MSASIDERIVEMKFNNGGFLNGIRGTLQALADLKKGTNMDGASKGLSDLQGVANRFSMAGIGTQVQGVNTKFLALATVAVTALSRITSAAMATGGQLVKSLTVDPIKQGLEEYETNLNSIQTILANTQSKGTTLDDVNGSLEELNKYSDQTIYNFAEMARNIGTFTAAGVDLDTSTNAIKGIANLAAVSGSNSQQASTAMYQLSQALSTGSVKLMDWNSVVNAGMGGELFQENIKETARNHGVAVDDIITKNGSFRDSLQEGWLSAEILTESLSKMTGDLTDEQLKSMGYTDEQIVGIQEMAKTAQDAATKVKTVSQLIGTLQEAAGSGWAKTWQTIFGDFEEAKELFTGVNEVLGGMIGASADARNKMLGDWKELGGRTAMIDAISNAFDALISVITPLKEAFRDIFPAMTGERLYELTVQLRNFTEGLKLSGPQAESLKNAAKGVFAIFDIGRMILVRVADVLGNLLGTIFDGSGTILEMAGSWGEWMVGVRDAIKNGEGLTTFFNRISYYLVFATVKIKQFVSALLGMFDGFDTGGAEGSLERVSARLEPLGVLGDAIAWVWGRLGGIFKGVWENFYPMAEGMSEWFGNISDKIAESMEGVKFDHILDSINTGLLAALVLIVKKFLSGGINIDPSGGLISTIKDTFGAVTDTFGVMQASLKASTLMKIATAIALIAASVIALSFVNSADLAKALAAITVMFTQLVAAMAILEIVSGSKGFLKMPGIAAALIMLSTAVLILSAAVTVLSALSWEELLKGLTGVTVLLGVLAGAAAIMSKNSGGLIRAGVGMIAVAVAIKILASAVRDFSSLSWEEMAKGLIGVSAALGALAIFTKMAAVGKAGIAQSAGLILLAVALKVLASVVKDFAEMEWADLGKGLAGMAASLLIMAGALRLMQGTIAGSAALLIASAALVVLSGVITSFAGMSWEEIAKGLVTLAGSLLILAGGMALMTAALPGAAALVVVSAALTMLAPVLIALGSMSWDEIGRGLGVLAGALAILGIAGLVLTPVIPMLLGLGAAIALIGLGTALAGAGVLALAVGLTALAAAGIGGAVAIAALGAALIGLIPAALAALAEGLVRMVETIADAKTRIVDAMVKIFVGMLDAIDRTVPRIVQTVVKLVLAMLRALEVMIPRFIQTATKIIISLLDAVNKLGPRIIRTLGNLLSALVREISRRVPEFAQRGLTMITQLLNVIAQNIGRIVRAGANIVINFMNGIGQQIPRLVQTGINLIIRFVNSLANGIRNNQARMNAAGRNLASAIISGMTGGLGAGIRKVTEKAREVARKALNAAKNFLGIKSPSRAFMKVGLQSDDGFAGGLLKGVRKVVGAAKSVGKGALEGLKSSLRSAPAISADVEVRPRVRPVLDLDSLRKGVKVAKKEGLLGDQTQKLSPELARRNAVAISAERLEQHRARLEELRDQAEATQVITNLTQNNYSPKALSEADIYRQSHNLLSATKGAQPKHAYQGRSS